MDLNSLNFAKMQDEKFVGKIDIVFGLMLEDKLRKDMDDTLFEKLLNMLGEPTASALIKFSLYKQLFYLTKVQTLFSRAFKSILESNEDLAVSTKTFAVQLLGIFFENQSLFLLHKESELLSDFAGICNDAGKCSPSIHVAVLSSLNCVSKHLDGVLWIMDQKLPYVAFASFHSSSFYVRKSGKQFLISLLQTCVSLPSHDAPPDETLQITINDGINSVITESISGILGSFEEFSPIFNDCCISTLKMALELEAMKAVLCDEFNLANVLAEAMSNPGFTSESWEMIIELLIDLLNCSPNVNESVLTDVINRLLHHNSLGAVICMLSSLKKCSDNTSHLIADITLLPLLILSSSSLPQDDVELFQIPLQDFCSVAAVEMDDKTSSVELTRASLSSLQKILESLNAEKLGVIARVCSYILLDSNESSEFQHRQLRYVCKNRKIEACLMQLILKLLDKMIYDKIPKDMSHQLLVSLIGTVECPHYDNNFVSQILKLIKTILAHNAKTEKTSSKSTRKTLMAMIQRKLLDTKWPIVDSALDVVKQMIVGEDHKKWRKYILDYDIHTTVWDIANACKSDGYVNATALTVLTAILLDNFYWKILKEKKNITEAIMVVQFFKMSRSPDIFYQRESVSCLFQWVRAKIGLLAKDTRVKIQLFLTRVISTSLDWDVKRVALQMWQWLAENSFPGFSTFDNLQLTMKCMSSFGFGSSLLLAISDHDNSMITCAAQIFLSIRDALLIRGYSQDTLHFDDVDEPMPPELEEVLNNDNSISSINRVKVYTEDEKHAAIDEVLDMYMVNRIHNVLRTTDDEEATATTIEESEIHSNGGVLTPKQMEKHLGHACSAATIWRWIWSDNVDLILRNVDMSSDVYSNDPVALLDDIILAKVNEKESVQVQDADCY